MATIQFNLRVPEELKNKIEEASKNSGRSINAEATFRLEESFRLEDKPYKVPLPVDFQGVQGVLPVEMGEFIVQLAMERAEQIRKEKEK